MLTTTPNRWQRALFSLMINLGGPGPGVADERTGCERAIATGSARQHLAYAGRRRVLLSRGLDLLRAVPSTCCLVTLLEFDSALSTSAAHWSSNIATMPELLSGRVSSTSALISALRGQRARLRPRRRLRRPPRRPAGRAGRSSRRPHRRPRPRQHPWRRVEVVVDVDLAVVAAADEDEPVELDHIVSGELLDGVPVFSGRVRIGIGRDVQIDRGGGVEMP